MTAAKYKKESTPEVKPSRLNGQNGKISVESHMVRPLDK